MAPFDKFHIFCDESGTNDRYTVIGLIICAETVSSKFERWLEEIAKKHGGSTELKWTKAKKHNIPLYKEYSSSFFKAKSKCYAQYFSIVIDNSRMNHRLYNEGDKEIGFNKMLFQLLYSMIRKFRNRPRFYAYLDDRTTKHTPDRLRSMLNAKAQKDLRITHNPYRVIQFRKSHECRMIQLVDVITGAIAFKTNQKHCLPNAASYKVALADHIESEAGVSMLGQPTTWPSNGFDIWHIDLRAYAGGIPRA